MRLTELIKPLQEMVDGTHETEIKIAFLPAYELSFLTKKHQEFVVEAIYDLIATPSLAQAQKLKLDSINGVLTKDSVYQILSHEKANQKTKISLTMEDLDQYFPKSYTPKQRTDTILKLLSNWAKNRERKDYER